MKRTLLLAIAFALSVGLMGRQKAEAWIQQPCNYFPLTIACGGTGATTAAGARSNLGAGAPIWSGNGGSAPTSATTVYFSTVGTTGTGSAGSEDFIYQLTVPIAATIRNLKCEVNTAEGASNTDTFTVRSGSALGSSLSNSTITCTISNATSCSDTTHTLALSAGNVIDYSDVTTGTPNARTMACSVEVDS